MSSKTIGWDIGGAHVKAVVADAGGHIVQVVQQPCPLWKGIDQLRLALAAIDRVLAPGPYRHAMTMTGELADCFVSREQGVAAIIDCLRAYCGEQPLQVYAGSLGLLPVAAIGPGQVMAVASANWLASAQLAAGCCRNALFADLGSTTTDLLPIIEHSVRAVGHTDYQRLVSGELVYTGVVRTSVMAIASRVRFLDREMGLMAEHFATMADVYRVLGQLPDSHDQAETADGAEKTPLASARRLSRLTGYEFAAAEWPVWVELARALKQKQQALLATAIAAQLQALPAGRHVLIGAGVGRFLLREIAGELGLEYRDFDSFCPALNRSELSAADCAPAAALALLAAV